MGRLIDTDKLDGYILTKHGESNKVLCSKSIADVPIAYDVEAVVKQIEEFAECDTECREFYGCRDCAYKEIIEIVRNGGVSNGTGK